MTSSRQNVDTLLPRLRQATQEAHLHVERHPLLAPMLSTRLDLEAYVRVLHAFRSFYTSLEPGLDPRLASGPGSHAVGYHYVPRAALLARDLLDLRESVDDAKSSTGSYNSPVRHTPEHTLGWLYVLEGATQGGRVIAPKVAQALGLGERFGARYFHLYTLGQWPRFKKLAEICQESYNPAQVIDGALSAFENLTAHLNTWITAERE